MHPLSEACGVVADAKQHGASAVDEHASQIEVAPLADAEQLLFASGGVLPGNDACAKSSTMETILAEDFQGTSPFPDVERHSQPRPGTLP